MKRLLVVMVMLLVVVMPNLAQDTTETDSTATEGSAGPITVQVPEGWQVLPAPGGIVMLTNFDTETAQEALPEDAMVVQIRLVGLPRVAGLTEGEQNATNIMGGLLLSQGMPELPEITLFELENYDFARTDISTEDTEAHVYVVVLSDASFAIVSVGVNTIGMLADAEAGILDILDTMVLDFETLLPEENQYAELPIGVDENGFPAIGNADAPVTIMEISSFDCPHCRTFHDVFLPELLPRVAAGELRFVYVPLYGTGGIPNGDSAARAAICVGTDNFWQFHDAVFSYQDYSYFAFMYERLQDTAEAFGVVAEDFDNCYISDDTSAVLEAARATAIEALGDRVGTPSLVFNGEVIETDLVVINAAIDAIIAGEE